MSVYAQKGGQTPTNAPVGTYWSYDLLGWAYDNSLRTWLVPGGQRRFVGQDTFYRSRGYSPTFDYPNPAGHAWIQRQYTSDLRTWINPGGQRRFVGQDTFYGTKGKAPTFDYPNPVGHAWLGRVFTPEYRTWAYKYIPELVGKDRFYGPPGKAPVFDYPNPKGYYTTNYSWYKDWVLNLRETPKPNLLMLPFDWGYQEKLSWYKEWALNSTILLPIPSTTAPFNQQDWRNPVWPFRPDFTYLEVMDLSRNHSLGRTFKQTDWPNPRDSRDYKREWTWNYNPNLIGKDLLPNNQDDWPNPRAYPRPDASYVKFTDLSRDASLGRPFRQLDWPNPRDRTDRREWSWNYNLNLIGKDRLPNRQQDWPNPQVVTWYKDWNNNLILIVPRVSATPFSQLDWPLSLAPTYWARDWNQNLVLTFGPTPVVVTDLHFKPFRNSMGRMGNLGGLH